MKGYKKISLEKYEELTERALSLLQEASRNLNPDGFRDGGMGMLGFAIGFQTGYVRAAADFNNSIKFKRGRK